MKATASLRPRLRRAFTLIELMVVVLILAILAALVVPKIVGNADKAKVAAARSDIAEIKSMLDHFHLDCDRYPTSDEGLEALQNAPSGLEGKWHGPYASKAIGNDPWGNPYQYDSSSNSAYSITSYGADGAQGGEGYDADIEEGSGDSQ